MIKCQQVTDAATISQMHAERNFADVAGELCEPIDNSDAAKEDKVAINLVAVCD